MNLPRFNEASYAHFITTKTFQNKKIFGDYRCCEILLKDIDFYRNKLGFKLKLRDAEKEPSKAELGRIKEIEQLVMNTGVPENFEDTPERRKRDNFEQFLRKIGRDTFTFDQINFEITPRNDGKPYSFQAIDPESIRIVPDEKEKREYFGGAATYGTKDFLNIIPTK